MIIAIPIERVGDSLRLSPHFGRSPYFTFIEVSDSNYRVLEVVENPHITNGHGEHQELVELLKSRRVDAVVVSGIGPRALQDIVGVGIKVYYIPRGMSLELKDIVKALIDGRLEEVSEHHYMLRHHECGHKR